MRTFIRKFGTGLKSHFKGPSSPNLIDRSISRQLELTASGFGDLTAAVSHHQSRRLTYAQLFEAARTAAANLLALGVRAGDRVGIYSANSLEWLVLQMACSLADAVFVTINPAYRTEDLRHCLRLTELNALVASDSTAPARILDNVDQLLSPSDSADLLDLRLAELPSLKKILVIKTEVAKKEAKNYPDFAQHLIENSPPKRFFDIVDRNIVEQNAFRPVNIQFTSGTTGLPKGALLTHHNILNNAFLLGHHMAFSASDKICVSVPLYHCFGMVVGNLAALVSSCSVVYPSPTFKAASCVEAIQQYGCTIVYGVPTMFIEMLKVLESGRFDVSSLQKGLIAGSLCPEILLKRVTKEMGLKYFAVGYGMTETSPITFLTSAGDSLAQQTQTVGRVLPHTEAKLIDAEGRTVEVGQKGEFVVRGYAVMVGYYNDRKASEKAVVGGWMHSGDIGVFDEEGFLHIIGRSKDIIIRGGENIAPKEIEDLLLHMDNVENVQVIGVEDEKLGEEICALIKLKEPKKSFDIKSIVAFLKPKIAHFKIPKYARVVETMPITITGKPQKFKMREEWKKHIQEIGSADIYKIK